MIFIEKKVDDAFPIKIYNPDGIEVGACGNGSRCVAYLIATENNHKSEKTCSHVEGTAEPRKATKR